MGRFTQRLGLMFCLSVGTTPVLADDLVSILDLAMQNDPSLKQAEAQYQSRHTLLDQGRALLMPSVALQGSTTRQTTGLAGQMSFRPGQNSHGYRPGRRDHVCRSGAESDHSCRHCLLQRLARP